MQAETNILITAGEFVLNAGGGSTNTVVADTSAKGIKAAGAIEIHGGSFAINAADDAIHSNAAIAIHGGSFVLASGDDGMHADASLVVDDGDIRITESYEGLESAIITINGGNIHVVASDDGVNVAGGNDDSGMMRGPRGPQDSFTYTGSEHLYINGGYTAVDAAGDGIDVNGAAEMTGGVVIVNGPTMSMNRALDYDAFFNMTGGVLVAAGSAGMAQAPSTGSTQPVVLIYFDTIQAAGTAVHVQSSVGEQLFTFVPTKEFQSIAFSSPALVTGATYDVYLGGAAAQATDGLSLQGNEPSGARYTSFTVDTMVTTIGTGGMRRPR